MRFIYKQKIYPDAAVLNQHIVQTLRCHDKNKMVLLFQNNVAGGSHHSVIQFLQL